jgi:WD40 repeat protein
VGVTSIVGLDIEHFGRRKGSELAGVRETLFNLLDGALDASGISRAQTQEIDSGDGGFVLIDGAISVGVLLGGLVEALARGLIEHNRRTPDPAQRLRLRLVVHAGEVARDARGYASANLTLTARLLDSEVLKAALARAAGDLVVMISDQVYRQVADSHGGQETLRAFRPVQVRAKETSTTAWLRVPDGAAGALVGLAGCPYRGLHSFDAQDAHLFFGRDRLVDRLLARLGQDHAPVRMLAVVGASGSGKSSLLRAGLLAAVARGRAGSGWQTALLTPGSDPVGTLATSLEQQAEAPAEHPVPPPSEHYRDEDVVRPRPADAADQELVDADTQAGPASKQRTTRPQPAKDQPRAARVLVVVDQFEELFTLCHDEGERRAFITALCAAATGGKPTAGSATARKQVGADAPAALEGAGSPAAGLPGSEVWIVLGLRGDFYSRCLAYPQLVEVLQEEQIVVGAMLADELQQAIELPAALANLTLEPGLTELLLEHAGVAPLEHAAPEPGSLPLLSYALQQTWHYRTGQQLTLEGYQRSGSIHQAIATSAELAYNSLDPDGQAAARRLVLELVAVEDGMEPTRRRVFADRLLTDESESDPSPARRALNAFVAARLLTVGADNGHSKQGRGYRQTVEIGHEALLRAWPRLRNWLTEDQDGIRIHRQLTHAAETWVSLGRDEGALYRGVRLAAAQQWATDAHNHADLAPLEQAFLDASRQARDRDQRALHRRARRLRRLTAGLSAMLAVAVVTAGLAIRERREASAQHQTAVRQARLAMSRQLATRSAALHARDLLGSVEIGIAAMRIAPTSEARDNLLRYARDPSLIGLLPDHGVIQQLTYSPDGHTLATLYEGGDLTLWDTTTRRVQASLSDDADIGDAVAYSPDGRSLTTAGTYGHSIQVWDPITRRVRTTVERDPIPPSGGASVIAYSPDGRILATGGDGVVLWNTHTWHPIATLASRSEVNAIAYSPDGRTLVTGGRRDGTVQVWDATTRHLRATLTGHTDRVSEIAFSPDGRTLATGSWDGTVRLWDTATRRTRAILTGHTGPVMTMALSPDGRTLAAGSDNGVRLWDMATHRTQAILPGGNAAIAYSPDGQTLATLGLGGIQLWASRTIFPSQTDHTSTVAYNPQQHFAAIGLRDGTVQLWDTTRRHLTTLTGRSSSLEYLAFSANGRILAAAAYNSRTVRLWDTATHHPLPTLTTRAGEISALAFSPDARILATEGAGEGKKPYIMSAGTIQLWDIATGRRIATLPAAGDPPNRIDALAFSPDGRKLASGMNGTVWLWDIPTRRLLAGLPGLTTSVSSIVFSPDGRTLASSDAGQMLLLWDASTGQRRATIINDDDGGPVKIAFSPDGRILAGNVGPALRLWDATTGDRLASIGGAERVADVTFDRSGRLLTMSSDGAIHWWETDPKRIAEQLCKTPTLRLTPQEWTRRIPDWPYQPICP